MQLTEEEKEKLPVGRLSKFQECWPFGEADACISNKCMQQSFRVQLCASILNSV